MNKSPFDITTYTLSLDWSISTSYTEPSVSKSCRSIISGFEFASSIARVWSIPMYNLPSSGCNASPPTYAVNGDKETTGSLGARASIISSLMLAPLGRVHVVPV